MFWFCLAREGAPGGGPLHLGGAAAGAAPAQAGATASGAQEGLVAHLMQRSASGTPARAAAMCCPQPAQVGLEPAQRVNESGVFVCERVSLRLPPRRKTCKLTPATTQKTERCARRTDSADDLAAHFWFWF